MDKILIPSHRRLVPKNDLGFLNSLCIPTCTKKKKKKNKEFTKLKNHKK